MNQHIITIESRPGQGQSALATFLSKTLSQYGFKVAVEHDSPPPNPTTRSLHPSEIAIKTKQLPRASP